MNHWLEIVYKNKTQKLVSYLSYQYSIGKGIIYKFIEDKKILINGKKINKSYNIKYDDLLIIKFPLTNNDIQINNFDIEKTVDPKYEYTEYILDNIIYEDENILLFNKPVGWATQNGINNPYNLDDLLKYYGISHYIVHRLDKDTSGLIIMAKNRSWAKILSELIQEKSMIKKYLLITPLLEEDQWEMKSYIGEDAPYINNQRPNSHTIFKKIKDINDYSLWEAQLITGKKHQIRIHCKLKGIPLLGDRKYHGKKFSRLCLHSYYLEFIFFHITSIS